MKASSAAAIVGLGGHHRGRGQVGPHAGAVQEVNLHQLSDLGQRGRQLVDGLGGDGETEQLAVPERAAVSRKGEPPPERVAQHDEALWHRSRAAHQPHALEQMADRRWPHVPDQHRE